MGASIMDRVNIDVFDVSGVAYSVEDLALRELPAIPDWFIESLNEIGGFCEEKPNLRIVSGLDPEVKEFYGGKWWLKYAFREHKHTDYVIWHRQGKPEKILTPKEAEVIAKSKKKEGIFIPQISVEVKEYGVPRYFLEIYKPPEAFGTPEAWEQIRYDKDENDKWFDLMGEFPYDGMYDTWFCIEEPVFDKDNKIVGTKFKELDEDVLEVIRVKVDEIKNKSAVQRHAEMRQEVDDDYKKMIADSKEEIKEIVKERIDRLVETPKSVVPNNYERNKT